MALRASLLVLSLFLLPARPSAAQPSPGKAAVVLKAPSLDEDTAFAVETKLRSEVERVLPLSLLIRSETRALLDGARAAGLDCRADDVACLASMGGVLGVQQVVYVELLPRGDRYGAELALVDVSRSRIARRVSLDVGASLVSSSEGMEARRLVLGLLAPERTGLLEVRTSPAGAAVMIDREPAPDGTLAWLEAGPHRVEVSLSGYGPFEGEATVAAGETTQVDVVLLPVAGDGSSGDGSAPMQTWLLPAGIASMAIGATVGVAGGLGGYLAALSAANAGATPKDAQAAADSAALSGGLAVGSVVAGALLVAVGAGALTFALMNGGE